MPQAFHRAWALSLLVWTPVQLLNLSLVPPPLQPAVVSAVNVGWKATLSLLNAMQHSGGAESHELRRHSSMRIERLEEENVRLRGELAEMREARAAAEAKAERENAAPACVSCRSPGNPSRSPRTEAALEITLAREGVVRGSER